MNHQIDLQSRRWALIFAAWLLAMVATLGSLFMSEIMGMTPCMLCWYQRIFMYPLVLVLGMALLPFDPRGIRYALPLAIGGWLTALYHWLLYHGVIPETLAPCTQGVSCKDAELQLLGFVSIPLLSLLAFSLLILLLVAALKGPKQ